MLTPKEIPLSIPILCLERFYSILEGNTNILDYQFFDCIKLSDIIIPSTIISIGIRSIVFYSRLNNITIPSSVSFI
jgi:hypothetical protein